MKRKAVTLKDIADQTGYSVTSVSHVINKTRHVEKATRDRILEAIERLGYVIPEVAVSTRGETVKGAIGVVIADIREDFFAEIVKSIEYSCAENGYSLILCDSEDDEVKERNCIATLAARQVQGLILFPVNSHANLAQTLPEGVPVVILDRKLDERTLPFIGIDNYASAYDATRYLIAAGARRIGMVGYGDEIYTARERARGYEAAMRDANLGHEIAVLRAAYHSENTTGLIRQFIASGDRRKDGLVCATSNLCFEAVAAIQELGLGIPEDLKLICWDDNKWFDYLRYPVSAIRQPTTEMGIAAVEELVARIEGKRVSLGKDILLAYELIDRLASRDR
jgi:LacI family transcriptional regulator